MTIHKPLTAAELKSMRGALKNTRLEYKNKLSRLEKMALFVTKRVGTMGFFFIILAWTLGWFSWNTLGPAGSRFDPFPAFVLWLFISNMIQIFLMPLIMIGQNLEGKHAEIRAEADFEVNLKAEREIETILQHLENQNELILKIIQRLEEKN